jgi:hypothetical protein
LRKEVLQNAQEQVQPVVVDLLELKHEVNIQIFHGVNAKVTCVTYVLGKESCVQHVFLEVSIHQLNDKKLNIMLDQVHHVVTAHCDVGGVPRGIRSNEERIHLLS